MAERNRLAVQTTLHPISYTTYEGEFLTWLLLEKLMSGGDGRSQSIRRVRRLHSSCLVLPSGERCGTRRSYLISFNRADGSVVGHRNIYNRLSLAK